MPQILFGWYIISAFLWTSPIQIILKFCYCLPLWLLKKNYAIYSQIYKYLTFFVRVLILVPNYIFCTKSVITGLKNLWNGKRNEKVIIVYLAMSQPGIGCPVGNFRGRWGRRRRPRKSSPVARRSLGGARYWNYNTDKLISWNKIKKIIKLLSSCKFKLLDYFLHNSWKRLLTKQSQSKNFIHKVGFFLQRFRNDYSVKFGLQIDELLKKFGINRLFQKVITNLKKKKKLQNQNKLPSNT